MKVVNRLYLLLMLSVFTALPSCSLLSQKNDTITASIEKHNYKEALVTLSHEQKAIKKQITSLDKQISKPPKEDVPVDELKQQRNTLINRLSDLEKQQTRIIAEAKSFFYKEQFRINQLIEQNDWQPAVTGLDFLKLHLPEGISIEEFEEHFNQKKQNALEEHKKNLVILDAKYLPEQLNLLEVLQVISEDKEQLGRYRQSLARKIEVEKVLKENIEQAKALQEWDLALFYARSLSRIDNSLATKNMLAEIQNRIEYISKSAQASDAKKKSNAASANYKKIQADIQLAFEENRLLDAKKMLSKAIKQYPDNSSILSEQAALNEKINQKVISAKTVGENLYSNGDIEQALELWREVLPLVPDDLDLISNIERAERILNKVNKLKEEQ